MLWRPSCPPFCVHVTDRSEINFNILNRFLDLRNLCVATEVMSLAHILKKILRILSFGGHLGRNLEYFNFPNDANVTSFTFNVRTYWRTDLCKNILCGLFLGLHSKSSFGNRTIISVNLAHCNIYFMLKLALCDKGGMIKEIKISRDPKLFSSIRLHTMPSNLNWKQFVHKLTASIDRHL